MKRSAQFVLAFFICVAVLAVLPQVHAAEGPAVTVVSYEVGVLSWRRRHNLAHAQKHSDAILCYGREL